MHRMMSLLAICAAAACATPPRAPATVIAEPPAPALDSSPPARAGIDLSDAWATGSTNEPAAKRLAFQEQCNYTPSRWITQQEGDTVRAWQMPEQHAQGIASSEPKVRAPAAEGRLSGVILLIFILFNWVGGDPAMVLAGKISNPEQIENIRRQLGIDQPYYVQLGIFVKQVFTFDFGRSWSTNEEVSRILLTRIGPTLTIMIPVLIIETTRGDHETLLAQDGQYARMYGIQQG